MRELDTVVLTRDLPKRGLRAGDVGTIVLVHDGEAAYEVEFLARGGETLAVLTLKPGIVAAIGHDEAARRRLLAL
jgi:hypothetical protein